MLVLDATVLINFGGVRAFDILHQSVNVRLIVVDGVVAEVRKPPATAELQHALAAGWNHLHHVSSRDEIRWVADLRRRFRHGEGEVASLAVCLAHGWDFASDDLAARRLASVVGGDRPLRSRGRLACS